MIVILLLLLLRCSVVSDSVQPYGQQRARLLSPWDSPGKNTGVGCHALLRSYFVFNMVAQLVKNLPAVRETYVLSLGWEDPLEKGNATYSRILAWHGL